MFDARIIATDHERWPFRAWVEQLLGTQQLESLHKAIGVGTSNYAAEVFRFQAACDRRAGELEQLVDDFVSRCLEPAVGKIAHRQRRPTFRAHFAVEPSWRRTHEEDAERLTSEEFLQRHYGHGASRNIFHRDADYRLPSNAVNVWLALTDAWGTNALWIGGPDRKGRDAHPCAVARHSLLAFKGAENWHGTVWNTTGSTRVSFDLRVIPA